ASADSRPTPAQSGSPLRDYVKAIAQGAREHPGVQTLMRAARWAAWNQENGAAIEFASRALELDPALIAAREFIVKIASADRKNDLALAQLRELLTRTKSNSYLREIAQLELKTGRVEEAARIFGELEKSAPG